MENERKLGVLWEKESKEGKQFLSGLLKIGEEEIRIVCFKVEKRTEKSPDWEILKSLDK